MYRITKEFHFSAAHQLDSLPADHQCHRLHGHNYIVVVELESVHLNEHGFVVDFGELTRLKHYIDGKFDHRFLNDHVAFETTAENLAEHFFDFCKFHWPQTVAVRVSETPKTWAEYRDDGN